MSNSKERPKVSFRQERRPLPKRFYKTATVAPSDAAFRILLDNKPARTPKKRVLSVPTRALAEAIASEWAAQGERVDPASMPLNTLANTVLDGVVGHEADVRADIVKYAGSDLLCYRAEGPGELITLQAKHWDPVLDWAKSALGVRLVLAQGVMPVRQGRDALDHIASAIADLDAFRLAALHMMTTLMGSALLALAVLNGQCSPAAAWDAAHVDEDWQIRQWGQDAEAAARRQRRWAEMQAACRLVSLVSAA
jgi:chaperone required for assembly of F1-ATPase